LKQVKIDSEKIVESLNAKGNYLYDIEYKALLTTPDEITNLIKEANNDDACAGIIGWMHTFSPSKMWIKGLTRLQKPFVQFHTQYNKEIPWNDIDMDFMNLNQTAHGGREFGFINARLRVPRKIIVVIMRTIKR
jgi:L-arabinose isomerase